MREIIKILRADANMQFLSPYVEDEKLLEKGQEVGLFHDRFIIQCDKKEGQESVQAAYKQVIENLAEKISVEEKESVGEYLKQYISFHTTELDIDSTENPITEVNNILDALELLQSYTPNIENIAGRSKLGFNLNDYFDSIKGKERWNKDIFIEDGFGSKKRFPSLLEVALNDGALKNEKISKVIDEYISDENAEEKIISEVEANKLIAKYEKYVAIIQVDGDKMGNLISSLDNNEAIKLFSKALVEYSQKVATEINQLGGGTIYAGGDDLLLFAPVKRIFSIIDKINEVFNDSFKKTMKEYLGSETEVTLSFGVSISYYKYPLKEALENARHSLEEAKKYKNKNTEKEKAGVVISVIKHSNKVFKICTSHMSKVYFNIKNLLEINKDQEDDKQVKMLNAIQHKLLQDEFILKHIVSVPERLEAYFENNFDENIHIQAEQYIKQIQDLINMEYQEYYNEEKLKESNETYLKERLCIQRSFADLQFIKFMKGEDD